MDTQVLQFPIKGVNRIFSRSTQPENTSYDMLNFLPFDGIGRLRGGKRAGNTKLWTAAIGDDTDAVVMLDQVTYAVDPATDGVTTLIDETFTYSNGDLKTASGNAWNVYEVSTGLATTVMVVSSHVCVTPKQSAGNVAEPIAFPAVMPDYDQAGGYSLSADVTLFQKDGVSVLSQSQFLFALEMSFATLYTTSYAMQVTAYADGGSAFSCDIATRSGTGDQFGLPLTVSSGVSFSLRVDVSTSRVATVFVNDVQVGTPVTLPTADGTKSFGFIQSVGDGTSDQVITDNVLFTAGASTGAAPTRRTKIIAVANRDVVIGSRIVQGATATSGSNVIKKGAYPVGCYSGGKYYIVDGLNIVQVDMATDTVESYAATAGTAPVNTTISCIWRDRLVLAGPDQNVYFSRVGTHTDWDYTQIDPGAAFAANASVAGHLGNPVVALIPLNDDLLAVGGDHDLHVVRGDPTAGGSIDLISDSIGMLGPRAWCKDPEGTVYFLGTGGLYKWPAGGMPVNISEDKWPGVFSAIDRSVTIVNLAWDRDKQGMYIFLYRVGKTITLAPTHLWYDRRLDGFFPIQFPVGHGPVSAVVYDGDAPTDRVLLLGCRDGYVRQVDNSVTDDDGTAIVARVLLGPIALGDADNDGVMGNATFVLGEPAPGFTDDDLSITATLRAGLTAYDVTEGRNSGVKIHSLARTYAGQSGRVTRLVGKVRGVWGSIELSDDTLDKTCSLESVAFNVQPAGLTRR